MSLYKLGCFSVHIGKKTHTKALVSTQQIIPRALRKQFPFALSLLLECCYVAPAAQAAPGAASSHPRCKWSELVVCAQPLGSARSSLDPQCRPVSNFWIQTTWFKDIERVQLFTQICWLVKILIYPITIIHSTFSFPPSDTFQDA